MPCRGSLGLSGEVSGAPFSLPSSPAFFGTCVYFLWLFPYLFSFVLLLPSSSCLSSLCLISSLLGVREHPSASSPLPFEPPLAFAASQISQLPAHPPLHP